MAKTQDEAKIGEALYSSTFELDEKKAIDVLAFMFMPERALCGGGDCATIHAAIREAKRDVLLRWYASRSAP